MDYKRDLYKQRLKKGQSDREVRDRLKKEESRIKKDALLLSKRRIPLSEIQEDKAPKKQAVQSRLERLKEWKKRRDEAKKKEMENKKRPFIGVTAASKKPQPSFSFGVSKSTSADKLMPKSSPSEQPPTKSQPGAPKPNKYAPPSKIAVPRATFTKRQATNVSSTASNASQKQAAKPPPAKSVPKPRTIQRRTPPVTRSSTRLVTRQTSKDNMTTTSRITRTTATRSMTRPKQSPQQKTRSSNKPSSSKPASANNNSSGKKRSGNKSSTKTNSSAQKTKEKIPIDYTSAEDMELADGEIKPSQPRVQPSPCYVSVRANSQVQEISFPLQVVDDPAWIPGATRTPKSAVPDFDAAFGASPFHTFSPFQFVGANKSRTPKQSFMFTFRKHVSNTPESLRSSLRASDISSDSLSAAESDNDVSSLSHTRRELSGLSLSAGKKNHSLITDTSPPQPSPQAGKTSPRSSASKSPNGNTCGGMVVESNATSAMMVSLVNPSPQNNGDTDPEEDTIDLAYFYGLHSQATEKLTSIAECWEEKLTSLENSEEEMPEDVLGQMRTVFGQARLLTNKKLKQYLGLVKTAEDQSGERKTTAEDLQGFWDMVYFQVDDIYRKSDNLTEMEKNGWKESVKKPATRKGKKRAVPASKPPTEKTSERAQAAREKREAARNKLRELRAAAASARRARETETMDVEVETEVPSPKRTKEEIETTKPPTPKSSRRRSVRKTPSKFRRVSVALINFDDSDLPQDSVVHNTSDHAPHTSAFSPPVGTGGNQSASDDSDVPTGQLLSFSPGKVDHKSPFKFRMTTPLKSPFKVPTNTPSSTSHNNSGGASLRKYISITPSKRVRDLIGADVIMSPVRRSQRLAENGTSSSSSKRMVLASLMDVPDDIDFAYCPNRALM